MTRNTPQRLREGRRGVPIPPVPTTGMPFVVLGYSCLPNIAPKLSNRVTRAPSLSSRPCFSPALPATIGAVTPRRLPLSRRIFPTPGASAPLQSWPFALAADIAARGSELILSSCSSWSCLRIPPPSDSSFFLFPPFSFFLGDGLDARTTAFEAQDDASMDPQ